MRDIAVNLTAVLTWVAASLGTALVLAGIAGGWAAWRQSRSLARISAGLDDLKSGNAARRLVVPSGGLVGKIADDINSISDSFAREREMQAEREEAHRKLLANISHDLRTPLTAIAGYADALARGLGDDPDRYLRILSAKTAELARLTDDLFYLTRMDAGDISLNRVTFEIGEQVAEVLLGFEGELAESGAEVVVRRPEHGCLVVADPSAVRRVLSNLVSNSLKHGAGMTRFEVDVEGCPAPGESRSTRVCRVEVVDDGPGFSAHSDALFTRGFAERGGSGLGLAICRGLIERMGGTLSAESDPGHRTAFAFVLPTPQEGAAARRPGEPDA